MKVELNDHVKLADHPSLKELAGVSGIVVRFTPKYVWLVMDTDIASSAGKTMIRKADEGAFCRGDVVKNMQGDDFVNPWPVTDESNVAEMVGFFQFAEDWAVGVSPNSVLEVLVPQPPNGR
jgi:hypothetical protein